MLIHAGRKGNQIETKEGQMKYPRSLRIEHIITQDKTIQTRTFLVD